jgi:hypothetical protein
MATMIDGRTATEHNARETFRAATRQSFQPIPERCWIIEYRFSGPMKWMEWHGMKHLACEVSWQLRYLRSKYPDYQFRAVKHAQITYSRTYIRI